MFEWLTQLFKRKGKVPSEEQLEALRAAFRIQYQNFRRLLAANNNALNLMAEIEEALNGVRPVSMAFIRSRSTRLAVNVFQIVRYMEAIAPGRYSALNEQFADIQRRLVETISRPPDAAGATLTLPLQRADLAAAEVLGGKMAGIGELGEIEGVNIPAGFVITSAAYRAFIEGSGIRDEINRIVQSAEHESGERRSVSSQIKRLIEASPLPPALETAIFDAYADLGLPEGTSVAMRSSAVGEDSGEMSFAGLYRTVLGVDEAGLPAAYKAVVAGKYSPQAMSYRLHFGIRDEDIAMCVGCMEMIRARVGGVIYTSNPLDDTDDAIFIYASRGLPQDVVNGADVETFVIPRDADPSAHPHPGGLPLDGVTLAGLFDLALRVEVHFGRPQDIEWVVDDDRIYLLQSRPLTRRLKRSSPEPVGMVGVTPMFSGGATASRGAAVGVPRVARGSRDADHFPEGAVLVVAQPLPDWATLLRRASAVVAEQGSVASHLANVARELGVPALFGVPGATDILDGVTEITVDADGGRIFAGQVESLLDASPRSSDPATLSPIRRILHQASELMLPLRLLDPEDPRFRPEQCRTFHDITRFCHEKAVRAMFRFGEDHDFPQRASRRLFTDVATQFWIVDLDDGLRPGADDPRWIRFDDIVSIPMLAVWRGMEALPWEGPPPADARGFLEVLAASAMDSQLLSAVPSSYSAGSQMMISRHYCSLHSRFGYHFTSVEALVGERPRENFVSFQFNGGGAGRDRRNRRARLVADLLEEKGFYARYRNDRVNAHMGGYDQPLMERALNVVGYLLVHTRQLDMSMTDKAAFEKHKQKMLRELEEI